MAINIKFTAQEIEVINSLKKQGEATAALVQKNIELAQSYSRADAEGKFWSRGLERQRKEMAFFKKDVSDVASTLIGMQSGALGGLGGAVGGLGGAAIGAGLDGLLAVGKEISATTERYNRLQMALDTATGSTIKGAEAFSFVTSLARQTGLRIDDLADSYKGFSAASRGTKLEGKETERIFTSIVKAGSAMMLSNEQVKGSLLAVSQMMSKGNVQAEELRGQLSERLPGAFNILAQEMGVTTAQLNDLLKAGAVLSEDALPKLAQGLDKISKDSYAKNLETTTGAMNNLRNEVDLAVVAFGRKTEINSFFASIINGAASVVRSGYLQEIGELAINAATAGGYGAYKNAKTGERKFEKITAAQAIGEAAQMDLAAQKRRLDTNRGRIKSNEAALKGLKDLAPYEKTQIANLEKLLEVDIYNYSLRKKAYDGERVQRAEKAKADENKLNLGKKEIAQLTDINKKVKEYAELLNDLRKKDPTGFTKSEAGKGLMKKIGDLNQEAQSIKDLAKLGKPEKPPKESGRTSFSKEYQQAAKALEKQVEDEKKARESLSKAIDDLVYRSSGANGQKTPYMGNWGFGFLKELQGFRSGAGLGSQVDITKIIPSAKNDKSNKEWTTALGLPDMKEQEQKISDWLNWYKDQNKRVAKELSEQKKLFGKMAQGWGEAVGMGVAELTQALIENKENPFKAFGQFMLNSLSDMLIKTGAEMLGAAALFAALSIPTLGITSTNAVAFTTAGLGMTAAGGAMKAVKFAEGGIVSGPTFSMTGEYRGARNNPEVIAPLNKFGNLLTPFFQRAVNIGRYNSPQLATQAINTQTNVYFDNKVLLTQIDKAIVKRGRI